MAQNKPLGEPQLAYRLPEAGGDLPHRLAHRVEKGVVGVLHQMRAVGNLIGVWQGLCGRLGNPRPRSRATISIWGCWSSPALAVAGSRSAKCGRLSAFKIANERAISMIAARRIMHCFHF
ncbi:hypothetical protein [Rhizobium leguminosarum]|uniref:hypothetical protein n=1 Tax=Rhizobium leguminosarum TaxID=384 RepID=UPI001C903CA5|nr:hypothetical protein [Rhizobium leguminosarum]MBY2987705.1 hypothetical protein [Rhizobium leguminosarum]